jgi:hypothetical protein
MKAGSKGNSYSDSARNRQRRGRDCAIECLESRCTLSTINWTNRGAVGSDIDHFQQYYGAAQAAVARQIVDRAIADWQNVVTNFNNSEINNVSL